MAREKTKVRDQDQFQLRLPDGMRDALRVHADDNGRSLNAEIVDRLQYTLEVKTVARQTVLEQAVEAFKTATADIAQHSKDMAHAANVMKWMLDQQEFSMRIIEAVAATDGHLPPEMLMTIRELLARRGSETGFPEPPTEG